MTDERIEWTGHPSQWQNLGWFLLCLLLIPIPFALWKWLETRSTVYTLTDQRLKFTRGVFSKTTEDLELFFDVRLACPVVPQRVHEPSRLAAPQFPGGGERQATR